MMSSRRLRHTGNGSTLRRPPSGLSPATGPLHGERPTTVVLVSHHQDVPRLAVLSLTVAALSAGCGVGGGCTDVGALTGVEVDISAVVLDRVPGTAEVTVCERNSCTPQTIGLTASGSDSETVRGFADFASGGMEPEADRVKLRLFDHAGSLITETTVAIKPKVVHPNGERCGPRGVYAAVSMAADGTASVH